MGHQISTEDRGKFAARFRATPALLAFCKDRLIDPNHVHDHFEFEYDLPKEVVELRATKVGAYWEKTKPPGQPMKFEKSEAVTKIEDNVREINEFFAKQKLRGGFHHGYVRLYHNGDDRGFFWNMGGRLYSQHFGESYQVLNSTERRKMTINDESVVEVDIRASYLTIFLSLNGVQLPEGDPYDLPGLGPEHREAVKKWMVATFGNSKPIVRWPPRMLKKSPWLKQHRVSTITEAALSKYPVLANCRAVPGKSHIDELQLVEREPGLWLAGIDWRRLVDFCDRNSCEKALANEFSEAQVQHPQGIQSSGEA